METSQYTRTRSVLRRLVECYHRNREAWFSICFGILDLMSGAISALLLLRVIGRTPWIIGIFPILLSVRGAGNGVFSGVLSTSLHLGTIEPQFRRNTENYYSLISAIFAIAMINSVIAIIIVGIYLRSPTDIVIMFLVMMLTLIMAVSFSVVATSSLGFYAFRRGLNPDDLMYPIMSTLNDVLISVFLLVGILILRPWEPKVAIVRGGIVLATAIIFLTYTYLRFGKNPYYHKTIREAYLGIAYVVVASSISGIMLSRLYGFYVERPEFLIILPLMMTSAGNVGSILVSRLTTGLSIGEIDMESTREVLMYATMSLSEILTPFMTVIIVGSVATAWIVGKPACIPVFMATVLLLGLAVIMISVPIVLIIASETFKRGLNPDNFSIPIITATADFLTIMIFFVIYSS